MIGATVWQQLGFDTTLEQVVGRLQHMHRRNGSKRFDLRHGKVADADRPDLPLLVKKPHGRGRLFDGHQRIRPVHLIDVDHVGAQPSQRIVDLAHDSLARRVAEYVAVAPFKSDLACDNGARPHAGRRERLADDVFRTPESIRGRGVDQIDAAIDRRVNRVDRILFVGAAPHPAADCPRAEAYARNA